MNRRIISMIILAVLTLSALYGLSRSASPPIDPPDPSSSITLDEAIFHRTSQRSYLDEPVTAEEVSALLHAAGGGTADGTSGPTRAYPSAGGAYPLNIHLVAGNVTGIEPGVYTYQWRDHSLKKILAGDIRAPLMRASLDQRSVGSAPAAVIITADIDRTVSRYGERGRRYVLIDAGAAMQNVQLKAVDLGLGSVVIGAFDDQALQQVLGLDCFPLLVMPVGRTRSR